MLDAQSVLLSLITHAEKKILVVSSLIIPQSICNCLTLQDYIHEEHPKMH